MVISSISKTKEQLIKENEELQYRLAEVEETIAAIRNGEVDAIVVNGSQGERVYSVSSAETPYRKFIEEMSEGAVTIAKDGKIIYCNSRFANIVQTPCEEVLGSSLKRYITPDYSSKLDDFLGQMNHEGHDVLIVSLTNTIYLRLSFHHFPSYLQSDNYIFIATDISDLKKRENELNDIIIKLVNHINILRALRIENISETLDTQGRKNKLEASNNILYKEILKLNRTVTKLKKEKADWKRQQTGRQ